MPTTLPARVYTATATAAPTQSPTPQASATITPSMTPNLAAAALPDGRIIVPILLYHHVSDEGKTRYFVPVATFRQQIQAIHDQGYQAVTISELADALRSKGKLPEKAVAITFDDGFLDTYTNALPVLQEYGYTATAYIITGTIDTKLSYGYMQEAELKGLVAAGWEIGSHSISHSDISTSKLGMGTEMEKSKQALEELLGVPVRSFSYPYGLANDWIKDRVAEYGYDSAVGIDIRVSHSPKNLYYLSRREVYHSLGLKEFLDLLVPGKDEQALLDSLSATPTP